jgi:hypothetical protein
MTRQSHNYSLRFARKLVRQVFRYFSRSLSHLCPALLDVQHLKHSTGPPDFCSTRTGLRIPWDEWKRDVMVVEIHGGISYMQTFVLGFRVLLMTHHWRAGYRVQAYNFSRRGCRAMVRVGDGEKERVVMPNPDRLGTLGNSLVSCVVSDSREPLERAVGLRLAPEERGVP